MSVILHQNKYENFLLYLSFNKPFYIPISAEAITYIESKVITEILEKKKIIIRSKNIYTFSIRILDKNDPNTPKNIIMMSNKCGEFKFSHAFCTRDNINENEPLYKEVINLILKCIKLYFEKYYKKVKPEDYEAFLKQLDLNYLYSLPFPSLVPYGHISNNVVCILKK